MIQTIYGSNAIENVGSSQKIIDRICKCVFAGDLVKAEYINECDKDYAEEMATLTASGRGIDKASIIRSRREIEQHAVAMKFLVEMLVVGDKPLEENIIKYAHQLLMAFSEHEKTDGVYRESDGAASHGLRRETDAEYEQRVRDAKRLKPHRSAPERTTKLLFFKIRPG